jgi:hypothetical protein
MKPRGAAMSKPDWANVAESAKASKSDWAHRTRGPGSFQYTVKVPLPVRQTDGVHRRRAVQRQGRAGHRRRLVVKVLVVESPTEGAPEVASWFVGGPVGETVQIPAGQTCMINPSLLVEDGAADDEPRVMQLR